jgi:hypothetical protein
VTGMWCEDCGTQFRSQCACGPDDLPVPERRDRWVGIDGHTYVGDPARPSLAYHADDCACRTSEDWH